MMKKEYIAPTAEAISITPIRLMSESMLPNSTPNHFGITIANIDGGYEGDAAGRGSYDFDDEEDY